MDITTTFSTVDTRYGLMTVPNADQDMIGKFLSRYGEWAWVETEFIGSVLPDGARILDAGAYIGTFGLGVSMRCAADFICFIEANPLVAGALADNVRRDAGFATTVIEALLVGDDDKTHTKVVDPNNLGGTSFSVEDGPPGDASVITVTLASLRQKFGAFDLIKLDIEGMELEVLRGDEDHLRQGQTTIWVECNEDARSLDVAAMLLAWGLEIFYFAFNSFNPDNFRQDTQPEFPWAFEAGLLAAPKVPPALPPGTDSRTCSLRRISSVNDLKDALWRTPRWGAAAWVGAADMAELAALVGRSLKSETYDRFLDGSETKPATLWQRLESAEAELEHARGIIAEERMRREAAEHELEVAQNIVLSRLQELTEERAKHAAAQRDLRIEFEQALAAASARTQRAEFETAKASARALVHLSKLGEVREDLEARLNDMQANIDKVAADARAAQGHLEARLRDSERARQAAEQALHNITTSSIWLLSAPLRGSVSHAPLLRRMIRKARRVVGAVVRRDGG
jgi:FkbM family methyltransferase